LAIRKRVGKFFFPQKKVFLEAVGEQEPGEGCQDSEESEMKKQPFRNRNAGRGRSAQRFESAEFADAMNRIYDGLRSCPKSRK